MPKVLSRSETSFCAFAALGWSALAGCQSYTAAPIDLPAHGRAFIERAADVAPVREFAAQLDRGGPTATVFDLSDGVTLAEAEVVALFFNGDLRFSRQKAGVALATAKNAGLWEDPVLSVDVERILRSVDHPWVVGGTIGITLPISGRLDAERLRAEAASEAEVRRVAAQEWSTRAELRRAWMEWSAATLRVTVQKEFLSRLDALLQPVERLEKAGEFTRLDARVFRIERLTGASDLEVLESNAAQAELKVRSLMGLSRAAPVQLVPVIGHALAPMTPEARRMAMLERNAELATLKAEYDVAEATLRREVRAQYPDLTIGPGGSEDEGDPRAILGLSLPLPLWNRNQQGVAEALANRDLARVQAHTGVERLVSALDTAELELRVAESLRRRIENEIVPLIDEQEADARKAIAAGRLDPLLTLDALTRQQDAKRRLIEARAAEAVALIRLDELTGPPGARTPKSN